MTLNSLDALKKEMGIKDRKHDEEWLRPRREKFLKCPKCGGQMVFHKGTNVLTCENKIEKDGKKVICGFTKILDDGDYGEFLFKTA